MNSHHVPVRPPTSVSLVDLLSHGYLGDGDILPGGRVEEWKRVRAEREYASFMDSSSPRPRSAPSSSSRPPIPRAGGAHVHHVRVRRDLLREGRETPPLKPFVLDACCVCLGRERSHALLPCFHLCSCLPCSSRLTTCPLCRTPVKRVQKVFF